MFRTAPETSLLSLITMVPLMINPKLTLPKQRFPLPHLIGKTEELEEQVQLLDGRHDVLVPAVHVPDHLLDSC